MSWIGRRVSLVCAFAMVGFVQAAATVVAIGPVLLRLLMWLLRHPPRSSSRVYTKYHGLRQAGPPWHSHTLLKTLINQMWRSFKLEAKQPINYIFHRKWQWDRINVKNVKTPAIIIIMPIKSGVNKISCIWMHYLLSFPPWHWICPKSGFLRLIVNIQTF